MVVELNTAVSEGEKEMSDIEMKIADLRAEGFELGRNNARCENTSKKLSILLD